MTQNTELQLETRPATLAVVPSPAQMLQTIIERGVTGENVHALEKLVDLYERMEERDAKKRFAEAFTALQKDMPVIVASSEIPNRGKYERFEDVMKVVGPLLTRHGFSISFSNTNADGRITETCKLKHVGGHEETNAFTVRVGGRADSETQADCKAATTAKRNALLNCLNIVIRQDCLQDEDNDPRNEGEFITDAQAIELQRRVQETDSDELAFMRVAGVGAISGKPTLQAYKSIMSGRYSELDALLARKEKRGR